MIINVFIENRNEDNAKYMKAYMKDNFEYLGIKTPLRKELEKKLLKEKAKEALIDKELVRELWRNEYFLIKNSSSSILSGKTEKEASKRRYYVYKRAYSYKTMVGYN